MQETIDVDDVILARKRGRPARDMQPILDAAVAVFAREGYAAATIEMISSEAVVSTATLYKNFINKQGMFAAVLEQMTETYWETQEGKPAKAEHGFSGLLHSLATHAHMSSQPHVRGIMRAWVSELRHNGELAGMFARKSGSRLIEELTVLLFELESQTFVDLGNDLAFNANIASQIMLGIVERFTLIRGLVHGDNAEPLLAPSEIAEKAVQALVAIYGTPCGKAHFQTILDTPLQ